MTHVGQIEPIYRDGEDTLYEVGRGDTIFLTFNVKQTVKLLAGKTTKSIADYPTEDYNRQAFLQYQLKDIL